MNRLPYPQPWDFPCYFGTASMAVVHTMKTTPETPASVHPATSIDIFYFYNNLIICFCCSMNFTLKAENVSYRIWHNQINHMVHVCIVCSLKENLAFHWESVESKVLLRVKRVSNFMLASYLRQHDHTLHMIANAKHSYLSINAEFGHRKLEIPWMIPSWLLKIHELAKCRDERVPITSALFAWTCPKLASIRITAIDRSTG